MGRRVLIVEENEGDREALRRLVRGLDGQPEVFCASDGTSAYALAAERRFQLFVVDVGLKAGEPEDVTGLGLVRRLRSLKCYEFTPVILLSTLEEPRLYSYSQLHCFLYLMKPCPQEQIEDAVSKALEFPMPDKKEKLVSFRKDGVVYLKSTRDIVYIENNHRKVMLYCVDGQLEVAYQTCEELLAEMGSEEFLPCSRYGIVNKRYIEEIDYTNRRIWLKFLDRPVEIGVVLKKSFRDKMEKE